MKEKLLKSSYLICCILLLSVLINGCSKNKGYEPTPLVNNDIQQKVNRFTKSNEFNLLQSNFPMNVSDLKIEKAIPGNIYTADNSTEKNSLKYLIIPVEKENKLVGQIWLYSSDLDQNKFTALYESLENYSNTGGSSTVYFSNGQHLMDLGFIPKNKGLQYSIKNVYMVNNRPKSELYDDGGSGNEGVLACTARVYSTAKKACEADSVCDTICDFTPTCHATMLAAAAGTCILQS